MPKVWTCFARSITSAAPGLMTGVPIRPRALLNIERAHFSSLATITFEEAILILT